ncbi:patj homolog [Contarinia nasturtii]|uniref:patj homolog n=1 Tax=Contarinia nasturtii TaxID=265458 RepID=UPI0012D42DF2|nr:patj homolog [Contarinia nasturtii]
MQTNLDISKALQQIEAIKKAVDDSDIPKLQASTADSLKTILHILQDPIFRSIIQIEDSATELNSQILQHPSMLPDDFDISLSGDLIINVPPAMDMYGGDYVDEQRVPSAQLSPRSPNSPSISSKLDYNQHSDVSRLDDERPQSAATNDTANYSTDIMASECVQIQSIELVNDGTGLGFGIIGARTSGTIVKTIKPGGVADRDSRLISGDHILQIGDVNLQGMNSEEVANVLRRSGTHVRLVVARPIDPVKSSSQEAESSAIVPARLLSDRSKLERYLMDAGYADILGYSSPQSTPTPTANDKFIFSESVDDAIVNRSKMSLPIMDELDMPETERFVVELKKDANGLGITIAGYVCEKEELSGIFVKSVSAGSAADLSGKIQVNDRIIEVDNQSLQGFTNHEAVEVLKKSGTVVSLRLERYLRGPKYEQLQQAIAANELKPQTPSGSGTIFPPPAGRSQTSSTQSIGTTELTRRPSLTSTSSHSKQNGSYTSASTIKLTDTPSKELIDPLANLSTRKLATTRDSIETTKIGIENIDIETHGVSEKTPTDTDSQNLDAAGSVTSDKPKYWVESVLAKDVENTIMNKWQSVLGESTNIIVAQIRKFTASSGLGISLEGTVDVEGGREVRPHHYIRSILPEGPVGQNGLLRSGDELLEVNGQRLLGMNHLEVVAILKELPQDVRMVCARIDEEEEPLTEENIRKKLDFELSGTPTIGEVMPSSDRLVKAKSDGSLATSGGGTDDSFSKLKSRSLEPLTGLAMWSSDPQIIELIKGERGLGFSILDYQDPLDANDTLIVIRSLVPGGVAQLDGRLIPGDRLLFVNDMNLENSSLDQAVQALKGAPKGVVRIGVAKPLPMADTSMLSNQTAENISSADMKVASAGRLK